MLTLPSNVSFVRALPGHQHDTGLDFIAHVQHQTDAGTVVDQADAIAVSQFARARRPADAAHNTGFPSR